MDPLSALIGGGASILGGLFNTSSQQAINTANIQQQQWSAEGGYLPQLVANANRAGLNPLAVLGQRGPDMAVQVSGQPGAGLVAAGRALAEVDPHIARQQDLADQRAHIENQRAQIEIANATQLGKNAAIEGARNMWVLEQLQEWRKNHPDTPPPGAAAPSLSATGAEWFQNLWNHPWDVTWPLLGGK